MHKLGFIVAVVLILVQGESVLDEKNKQGNDFEHSHVENSNEMDLRTPFDDNDEDEHCVNSNQSIAVPKILSLSSNATAWIIDNAIEACAAKSWLNSFNPAKTFIFNHMNYSRKVHSKWGYGLVPWTRHVDVNQWIETASWKAISDVVEGILEVKMKVLGVKYELLRSMDAMPPSVNPDCIPGQYVLTIFLHKMWNLNNYGQKASSARELYNPTRLETYSRAYEAFLYLSDESGNAHVHDRVSFYNVSNFDPDHRRWEICATVHPHPHRAILWPACHPVLFRAPCINHYHHLKLLNVKLTPDLQAEPETPSNWLISEDVTNEFAQFTFTNPSPATDYSNHLVRTFNDGNPKRQVHIFDDLFTQNDLLEWRHHLLRFQPLYTAFDDSALEDHDNVQWVRIFEVEDFMKSAMWPRLEALCEFVSNHSGWHPYDVALNYVRTGDHTRIHPDSEPHQEELTMVMYLNEDLTPSDFGETTFYVLKPEDGVHQFIGDGGEVFEAIGTVAPKFGRVSIFTNNIEHSAHPPSSLYLGGRYTFALKVSKSKRLALIKMLYEAMESLDLDEEMDALKRELETGGMDSEDTIPTPTLERLLVDIKREAKEAIEEQEKEAHARVMSES